MTGYDPDLELKEAREFGLYLRRLAETGVGIVDPSKTPFAPGMDCRGFGPDPTLRRFKVGMVAQGLPGEEGGRDV